MILVGKKWDEMDTEHVCCTEAIRAIRRTRSRGCKVKNLNVICNKCDTTWVFQYAIFGDDIRMGITLDGSPVRNGHLLQSITLNK